MNLRPHKAKSYDQRKEEDADFAKFIAEKCESAQQPIQVYTKMCQDFIQITGCSYSVDALRNRISKFREGVAANTTLPHNTKVKQLFALGVSLDPGLLRTLQLNATVTVDDKNRITTYVAKNNALKLEGIHRRRDTASSSRNGEEDQDPTRAPTPKRAKTRESSTANIGDSGRSATTENPAPKPSSAPKNQINPAPATPKAAPNPPVRIPENPAQQSQRIEVINLDDDEEEDIKPVIQQMNLPNDQNEQRVKVENPEGHVEPAMPPMKPPREFIPIDAQKTYLKYTQNLMATMKVPADEKLLSKIQTKIEEIERIQTLGHKYEEKVRIDIFGTVLIGGINLAKMNLEPLEDSRSLREFTLLLQMNILHLGLPEFVGLQGIMDKFLEEPEHQNMRVSVSRIVMVVGMIVDILMA